MGSKLHVGGLPYSATESKLNTLFAKHSTVESARIIVNKGQSKGVGFVEMPTAEEAQAAITALNGSQLGGRSLTVNEARSKEPSLIASQPYRNREGYCVMVVSSSK